MKNRIENIITQANIIALSNYHFDKNVKHDKLGYALYKMTQVLYEAARKTEQMQLNGNYLSIKL